MKYVSKAAVTKLSYEITGCAITVHKALGPGLLESIYEKCLCFELEKNGFDVQQQIPININYDGYLIDSELKLDLLVEDTIIVELKTVKELLPVHTAQLMSYMKLLKKPQGLLFNFYSDNLTKAMKPLINEYFESLI
ncbi:GxxExxY protein [Algoriphagus sp. A40]|uniref:GxxExxY protein n=1 Tax=Algoriphagus sp. A40 TaxID=1945863 RepID=UPI0009860EC5|nr:GxxExxY protein [Algoriphagus sp. A40]OOG70560.1 GxxExxY protein [Algoriphagus sp. A40]